ncbi:unnamed protein product [Nezara viridula]|uniref:Epoxide hydrolase n=1 Tax=Nezara viridula TaxID=85310 RepID=A0A9P0H7J5_NEZVI|nr:unnamed protein product [Nezara viridula]CAH1396977.1 unnamed protein product [Nezara viridula]
MGCLVKLSLIVLVLAVVIGFIFIKFQEINEIPKLKLEYWGPGKEKSDDKTIRPFKISIPASELKELMEKLDKTRQFTPPLEGVGFEYGFNTDYLKDILQFWKTKYNWTEREAYLNSFPQFTTEIGGLDIHFLHAKPDPVTTKGKQVLPLLIMHGWPGAVREFYHLIPLLTTPQPDFNFVFEVVIPSLPGYTFSQGATKPGLASAHIAVLFDELMSRLNHDKYYVHGEDWGSAIGNSMAILNPNKILGFHSTLCAANTPGARFRTFIAYLFPKLFVDESMQEQYTRQFTDFIFLEAGFLHIQATKPDTVGVALNDSPIGLAAYILEKFSTWTNKNWRSLPNGGLENLNKVELIDNIMLYWFTKSITTSMRLYSEQFSREFMSLGIDRNINTVPTACAWFKNELLYYPKFVLEASYKNLVQVSHFPKGGHFSGYEEPKLVADDIWKFVKTLITK